MSHLIYSDTICKLGEGVLWHPETQVLYWFDILGNRLYGRDSHGERHWQFDRHVSAAGWVDATTLLIASEIDLFTFDTATGVETRVVVLEEDNPVTRSNDGRADPWGGFWIGTMGKAAEPGAGAIYRLYRGELRLLYDDISISNAICFAPGGAYAYFADTPTGIIRRVALDTDGWPSGEVEDWLDLRAEGLRPDGAVCDSQGNVWNAQYGAGRVACYSPEGRFMTALGLAAGQTTCPAFGGPDLTTLFVTSAAQGCDDDDRMAGMTFSVPSGFKGLRANRVVL
ncbi:SMP-30/gluconolactonase/LRE family protein [Puniceibacterium sp. IMCC21224]|uniref:SMP-30/gluconolactonase/LRE family protein n=1 Tax=Puniceibacterium sp. IMCC21224 TaxID=1618204 RepID=UPI00064D9FB1|nr:SMP-30/gluconolactonase/LRE family protein [Puniceibacterium sp. IMCC21224]KMK67441.1 gluconolactonase [Puniceibacterium sp. IMCC21224]